MVCLDSSISSVRSLSLTTTSIMSNPSAAKPKIGRNKKLQPSSSGGQMVLSCDDCQFAFIDVMLLIAVVGAIGCLLFPYAKFVTLGCVGIVGVGLSLIKEEVSYAPALYGSIALGMVCATLMSLMVLACTVGRKCDRPDCRGMRKAAAFDVHVETEEAMKTSGSVLPKDTVREGMHRFRRDHLRELENRLRKMAPVNGKAVLIYRARCGCSAGKMEVPGPRILPPRGKIKN